jgi:hypothetical protein
VVGDFCAIVVLLLNPAGFAIASPCSPPLLAHCVSIAMRTRVIETIAVGDEPNHQMFLTGLFFDDVGCGKLGAGRRDVGAFDPFRTWLSRASASVIGWNGPRRESQHE